MNQPRKNSSVKAIAPALAIALALSLSSCKTDMALTKPLDTLAGEHQATQDRLAKAARDAVESGKLAEATNLYAKLYKGNAQDKKIVLAYSKLLRKTENPQKAVKVLGAYGKDDPDIKMELGAALIAAGDFEQGEKVLNAVLENEKYKDYHIEAYNLMGVVLDSKGQHKEAEVMFRQALDKWAGNPASVMNNLALSLASQGMFDQSLHVLREALVISPDKQEVARNIQIVSDLRESIVPEAPLKLPPAKKVTKPKRKSPAPPPACAPCPDELPG